MFYSFKCINEECKENEKETSVSLPMSERDTEQFCSICKKSMQRVFKVGSIKTADGTK